MWTTLQARHSVKHRHRVARPVDEQLLAGGMRLPHGRRNGFEPIPIEISKATIAVAIDVLGPVPLPQQQRHTMSLQLLVDVMPIRMPRWGFGSNDGGVNSRRSSSASCMPIRHRQVMPTTPARGLDSATVDRPTPTDTAIWRSLRPSACASVSRLREPSASPLSRRHRPPLASAQKEAACLDSFAASERVGPNP